MKCPTCGYVSFDDLAECKKCGASFGTAGAPEAEEQTSRLQEELFSLGPGEDEEDGAEAVVEATEHPGREQLHLEPASLEPAGEEEFTLAAAETEEVPLGLPAVSLDFDPAEEPGPEEEEETAPSQQPWPGTKPAEELPAPSAEPAVRSGAIIDDETRLPEELWVEEGAGFLPRLLAFAVDGLILGGVLSLFFLGALAALASGGYGWSHVRTPAGIYALSVPFYLLGLLVSLGYFTFFVGWAARTPGKALLALDVRRTDGGPMTYSRAFLRWVGYLVSATFAGLGFLWVFFDERKRGWHDYLSGTWVKNLRHEH